MVSFLASEEASFITGHAPAVDGGMTVHLQEDLTLATARYAREHEFKLG